MGIGDLGLCMRATERSLRMRGTRRSIGYLRLRTAARQAGIRLDFARGTALPRLSRSRRGRLAATAAMAVFASGAAFASLPAPAVAARMGSPSVAALQVALRAKGLYSGTIDGFAGPGTRAAVRSLQRRAGISVDGVAGPQTLR